ncbi:uncharacterized protein LOC143461040 [Clavelina lepadiformis]|uniref:uncharacterized protein LOC143461040 n=1 Tax=Clavelina lepadiformis TaxID=159417 RepID=UPI0040424185
MKLNYLVAIFYITLIKYKTVGQQAGDEINVINFFDAVDESLNDTTSTEATTTTTSTTTIPAPVVDGSLPGPTNLRKISATEQSITFGYRKPDDFTNNLRYTDFLVEIQRNDSGRRWNEVVPKNNNPNNLVLSGLMGGVLYTIRIRSRRLTLSGQYVISGVTSQINARTRPPPATDLDAVRSESNWTQVVVSYKLAPMEVRGSQYDRSNLTYSIESLTPEEDAFYEAKTVTTEHARLYSVLSGNRGQPLVTKTLNLVPGAPYRYTVVTYSDRGDIDPTESVPEILTKTIELPKPVNLTKVGFNASTINLSWDTLPALEGITSYNVSWSEVRPGNLSENGSVEEKEISIQNLIAGALYHVKVFGIRKNARFGKKTDEADGYFRTKPPLVENAQVTERNQTSLVFKYSSPSFGRYTQINASYQEVVEYGAESIRPDSVSLLGRSNNQIILRKLKPGALYQINFTTSSEEDLAVDATYNTAVFYGRTNPSVPRDFSGESARGTIALTWNRPNSVYLGAIWRYKIDYYREGFRNQTLSRCQSNRAQVQKITLPNLLSGTGYYITLAMVAGESCRIESATDYITYSLTQGPILVYTQPSQPRIKLWKQITLNTVRIVWWSPSDDDDRFDYYQLEVRRVQNAQRDNRAAVPSEGGNKSFQIDKGETEYDLTLTQGATYRVNLATVAGTDGGNSQSIIDNQNTVRFTTWHRYYDHFLFPRLEWKFTTCGRSGRLGPSQVLCDNAYLKTSLENIVVVKNGIQHWTAPVDGLYRVVAAGAGYEGSGGLGASASGLFPLKEGALLKIAVGQRGSFRGSGFIPGGGGGTFVISGASGGRGMIDWEANTSLIVAGGAGSTGIGSPKSPISNARLSYNGGNASEIGSGFGRGGIGEGNFAEPGMRGAQGTGGGAGFNGVAEAAVVLNVGDSSLPAVGFASFEGNKQGLNDSELSRLIPLSGGRYQYRDFRFSEGGFGGGGSSYSSGAGGGGGYSGGGAGPIGGYSGGGGSFIRFSGGQEDGEITNDKPGFVTITLIGLPLEPPIPLAFYLAIAFVIGVVLTFLCAGCLYGVARMADRYLNPRDNTEYDANDFRSASSYQRQNSPRPPDISQLDKGDERDDDFSSDSSETEEEAEYSVRDVDEGKVREDPKPLHAWPSGLNKYDTSEMRMEEEEESDSESTVSSVSSMATGFTESKFDVDSKSGKLRYRGSKVSRPNSSFTGFESTDLETSTVADNDPSEDSSNSDDSFPSAPSSPPRTPTAPEELASEEQKQEFRQRLSMFHEMALKAKTSEPQHFKRQPKFVPKTNL